MDWENERYVRLYTRDTTAWVMWRWEARAFLPSLMRKLDRQGRTPLDKKHGIKGLAALVQLPVPVVKAGLDELIEDGCLRIEGDHLVMPNFAEGQSAKTSAAQRKREQRERETLENSEKSRDVTARDSCHSSLAEPSLAEPSLAEGEESADAPPAADAAPLALASPSTGPTLPELQALWNERLPHPPFPRWVELGPDQRKQAKRIRERALDGETGWIEILRRIGNSSFCRGSNDRAWVADPDFLLRVATPRKVLEGKYDDRTPMKPQAPNPYRLVTD